MSIAIMKWLFRCHEFGLVFRLGECHLVVYRKVSRGIRIGGYGE